MCLYFIFITIDEHNESFMLSIKPIWSSTYIWSFPYLPTIRLFPFVGNTFIGWWVVNVNKLILDTRNFPFYASARNSIPVQNRRLKHPVGQWKIRRYLKGNVKFKLIILTASSCNKFLQVCRCVDIKTQIVNRKAFSQLCSNRCLIAFLNLSGLCIVSTV